MNRIIIFAALACLCFGAASCGSTPEPSVPKVSIFCDHIESVARQEGIPFAEAAKLIKDIGFTGADVRVFQKEDEIRALDSLGFEHACAITDINYSKGDQKELEDKTIAFMTSMASTDSFWSLGCFLKKGFPNLR